MGHIERRLHILAFASMVCFVIVQAKQEQEVNTDPSRNRDKKRYMMYTYTDTVPDTFS